MPECVIIGGGPSGAVIARILQKRGFSTAIVDMRMEIGAPMTCDDLVNIGDIRLAGADPDEMPMVNIEGVEVSCMSARLRIRASGREGDAFNAAVETDRLKKELTALAALEGSDIHIRTRAENVSVNSNREFEVMLRTGSRQDVIKSRFLVLAGGSWDSMPAFEGSQPVHDLVRTGFNYRRTVSRSGESKIAAITFGDADCGLSIENPVPGGFRDSVCMMPQVHESVNGNPIIASGSVASGHRNVSLPGAPLPEYGEAMVVGLQSGLWNPLFPSAFHHSVATAMLAAECITGELEGRIENAVQNYALKFNGDLAPSLRDEFLLYSELGKAKPEAVEDFIRNIASAEYSEISLGEIERRMHLDIDEVINLLKKNH